MVMHITCLLTFKRAKILWIKRSIKIYEVFGLTTTDDTSQMSVIDECTLAIHMAIHTSKNRVAK